MDFRSIWNALGDKIRRGDISPRGHGEGKHRRGKQRPRNWRIQLNARRKAERQHRRRVQLQANGRKHRA